MKAAKWSGLYFIQPLLHDETLRLTGFSFLYGQIYFIQKLACKRDNFKT